LFRDRPLQFRLLSLFALSVWSVFYILTGSVAGILQALLIGGSIALALWRFDRAVYLYPVLVQYLAHRRSLHKVQ
jgi:hypothetical protein